jgi:hypothetical protein
MKPIYKNKGCKTDPQNFIWMEICLRLSNFS